MCILIIKQLLYFCKIEKFIVKILKVSRLTGIFFFCFSLWATTALAQNPYNINGLRLWWKTDNVMSVGNTLPSFFTMSAFNPDNISHWTSIATPTATAIQISQGNPNMQPILMRDLTSAEILEQRKFNFHSYVKFDGGQALSNLSFGAYHTYIGNTPTIFMVTTAKDPQNTFLAAKDNGGYLTTAALQMKNDFRGQIGHSGTAFVADISAAAAGQTHFTAQQPRIYGVYGAPLANQFYAFSNETIQISTISGAVYYPDISPPSTFFLGSRNGFQELRNDDVAEILIYNRILTASEINRINSYLAIKYGITLKANYYNSNDAIVYDYNAHAGFNNNITAVARDNTSGSSNELFQKKSRSVNPEGLLTLYMGGTAANNVGMNTQVNISTDSLQRNFFFIGDNNATTNLSRFVTAGEYGNPANTQILNAMGRTWKMWHSSVNATIRHNRVSFSLRNNDYANLNALYVIVADDPAFTTNVSFKKLTMISSLVGYYIFDNRTSGPGASRIPIPHGKYFTLAEFAVIPEFELDDLCQNDPIYTLPPSLNNVTGSWSPAIINPSDPAIDAWFADPSNTGPFIFNATFNPNPGQNAPPVTLPIAIYSQPITGTIQFSPSNT